MTDVNEAPTGSRSRTPTVAENEPAGTTVGDADGRRPRRRADRTRSRSSPARATTTTRRSRSPARRSGRPRVLDFEAKSRLLGPGAGDRRRRPGDGARLFTITVTDTNEPPAANATVGGDRRGHGGDGHAVGERPGRRRAELRHGRAEPRDGRSDRPGHVHRHAEGLHGRRGVHARTPNFNGPAGFTYTASDGGHDSLPAAVSITVDPVNDAPVAQSGEPGDAMRTRRWRWTWRRW